MTPTCQWLLLALFSKYEGFWFGSVGCEAREFGNKRTNKGKTSTLRRKQSCNAIWTFSTRLKPNYLIFAGRLLFTPQSRLLNNSFMLCRQGEKGTHTEMFIRSQVYLLMNEKKISNLHLKMMYFWSNPVAVPDLYFFTGFYDRKFYCYQGQGYCLCCTIYRLVLRSPTVSGEVQDLPFLLQSTDGWLLFKTSVEKSNL